MERGSDVIGCGCDTPKTTRYADKQTQQQHKITFSERKFKFINHAFLHLLFVFISATLYCVFHHHDGKSQFASPFCNLQCNFISLSSERYTDESQKLRKVKNSLSPSDLHFHFELIVVHFNLLSLPAAVIALRRLKFEYSLIFFFFSLLHVNCYSFERSVEETERKITLECETEREIFVSSSECKLWNSLILLIQQIYSGFCATFPSFVVCSRVTQDESL